MLVAAAVLPSAPLLVPELGRGLAADVDPIRAGCAAAVDAVAAVGADAVFIVGADADPKSTTFAPWGADVAVDVPEPLPLPLLVGAWFTRGRQRSFVVVDPGLSAQECAALGRDLSGAADRVALVAVGDGSARHDVKAPGYVDPRAPQVDAEIAAAFEAVDPQALLGLDEALASELMIGGRRAWQVLAGALGAWRPQRTTARFAAPFGVGYHVVSWT